MSGPESAAPLQVGQKVPLHLAAQWGKLRNIGKLLEMKSRWDEATDLVTTGNHEFAFLRCRHAGGEVHCGCSCYLGTRTLVGLFRVFHNTWSVRLQ